MIHVRIYTEEISRSGRATEELAAAFTVRDRELILTDGDVRHLNLGLPVFSEARGATITFMDAPEEWAALLPTAYRGGGIRAVAQEIALPAAGPVPEDIIPVPAMRLVV